MDIFKELEKLNFPQGQYVVVGSGPMAARNIKEPNDIDIVVNPGLFEKCKQEGWGQMPRTYPHKIGQIYLRKDKVELFLDVNCGDFNPTLEELLQRSDTIEGISFASLNDVVKFKRAYNQPKHLEDIKRIEEYLNNNH